jgi:16S rRNA (guanine527-N7)-methyltransferase
MDIKKFEFEKLPIWGAFLEEFKLNAEQVDQFAQYLVMLKESNELFNLTAITDPADIIAQHFQDSLAISKFVDFKTITMIADVGTGAGFPGIPLKILFPELEVILIEVTQKKIEFLHAVIKQLQLKKCRVFAMDWRTFLRKTNEPINLFVSRASLHTGELIRALKPGCTYKKSRVIYWASKDWHIMAAEQPFFEKEEAYTMQDKHRRLIFFVAQSDK